MKHWGTENNRWLRRFYRGWMRALAIFFRGALLLSASFLAFRLSYMQTDGLLAIGAVYLASGFAFTSLLFSRARAVIAPRVRRRSAFAAELAFRGTVFFLAALLLGVAEFYILSLLEVKPQPLQHHVFPQLLPLLFAFPVVVLIGGSLAFTYLAFRTVLHRGGMGYVSVDMRARKSLRDA